MRWAPSADNPRRSRSSRLRLQAFSLGRINSSGFHEGSGWVGPRMHEHRSFNNLDAEGWDLFLEWRRSRPRLWLILVAMPRAGNAAIDDAPFPERSVLMLASI